MTVPGIYRIVKLAFWTTGGAVAGFIAMQISGSARDRALLIVIGAFIGLLIGLFTGTFSEE